MTGFSREAATVEWLNKLLIQTLSIPKPCLLSIAVPVHFLYVSINTCPAEPRYILPLQTVQSRSVVCWIFYPACSDKVNTAVYCLQWNKLMRVKMYLMACAPSEDSHQPVHSQSLFVCVEVLWSSQPHGVMSSAVSLPDHTFTGPTESSKGLTSIVHIL